MSDIEAQAQHSDPAEEIISQEAAASGEEIIQNEPQAGSDEAIENIVDIDSWRDAVGNLPPVEEKPKVDIQAEIPAGPQEGEEEVIPEANEDEPAQKAKLPPQYRWRPKTEVDALAMDIVKRAEKSGKEIALEEALYQAKAILVQDPVPEAGEVAEGAFPATVEESLAMLAEMRADRKQAFAQDLDFAKAADLDERIEAIKDHIAETKRSEAESEQEQRLEWEQTLEASKARAVEAYPDTTNAQSALVLKMVEIDAQLKEDGNPLFHAADKPLKLAQMAANELGIAPRRQGAAPTRKNVVSSQPAQTTRSVQPAGIPVSGSARTTQVSNNGQIGVVELDKVNDEESWRAAMKKLKAAS